MFLFYILFGEEKGAYIVMSDNLSLWNTCPLKEGLSKGTLT